MIDLKLSFLFLFSLIEANKFWKFLQNWARLTSYIEKYSKNHQRDRDNARDPKNVPLLVYFVLQDRIISCNKHTWHTRHERPCHSTLHWVVTTKHITMHLCRQRKVLKIWSVTGCILHFDGLPSVEVSVTWIKCDGITSSIKTTQPSEYKTYSIFLKKKLIVRSAYRVLSRLKEIHRGSY